MWLLHTVEQICAYLMAHCIFQFYMYCLTYAEWEDWRLHVRRGNAVMYASWSSDIMFPSISQSATALGFHAPLPGLPPAAAVAGPPAITQSSSLSTSVGVYNAAPSAASNLRTTVVSNAGHCCTL